VVIRSAIRAFSQTQEITMHERFRTRSLSTIGVLLLLMILGVSVAAAAEVATLRSPSPDQGVADETPLPVSGDPMDAMLDFVACMRENGVDMPDPQAGSGMILIEAGTGDGTSPPSFGADDQFLVAEEACRNHLDTMAAPGGDPELDAEMMEGLLAYAECMRENGVDMPDPDMSGGMINITIGADGSGSDPFSVEYQAAEEACRGIDPFGFAESQGGVTLAP
jgi:hypothetical protein